MNAQRTYAGTPILTRSLSIRSLAVIILLLCLLSAGVEVSFAQDGVQTHTVQPGEYLSTIAAQYGTTVAAIIRANGIRDANLVRPGQVLTIPAGRGTTTTTVPPTSTPQTQSDAPQPVSTPPAKSTPQIPAAPPPAPLGNDVIHTVYPGESLTSIGRKYGTDATAIMVRNGLPSSVILSGQRLIIPVGVISAPPDTSKATPAPVSPTPTPAPTRTVKPTKTSTATPTRIAPQLFPVATATSAPSDR